MSDIDKTEDQTVVEAPEPTLEAPEPPQATDQGDDVSSPNKEAAKYRRAARDAEGQRDALAARLDAAHTTMLSGTLKGGVTPDALIAAGHTLDSLRDEEGNLDPALIAAAEADTAARFGIQKQRMIIPNEGKSPSNDMNTDSWTGAFAPKE